VTREARGQEELVELRDACRHGARPAGMEALERLRCGDGGESIYRALVPGGRRDGPLVHTRGWGGQWYVLVVHGVA